MSTKFKVGDRVRFKEQYHNWVRSEEAVVVKIETDAEEYTLATVSNGHRTIGVYTKRLELVPTPKPKVFEVGDEVEFLRDGWVLTEGRKPVELPTGKDAIIKLTRHGSGGKNGRIVLLFRRDDDGRWQIIRQDGVQVDGQTWRNKDFEDELNIPRPGAPANIEVLYVGH